MKPTATGRILFWRGGSLWIGLAGEPSGLHAHHAVQITLPFPLGRARLQRPSESWTSYTAAIVAAHQPHGFEARNELIAQIFVEPESAEGRRLQQCYGDRGISPLDVDTLGLDIAAFAAGYEAHASDAELIALARAAIAKLAGANTAPRKAPDSRVARAVELIRERLGDAIPLGAIATAVHLSPDRFRHLFLEETGVGFRPYVLWLRLECSLGAYVAGSTLTEAAYTGGFADSAHFSRTFKKMFGISPASVRPE